MASTRTGEASWISLPAEIRVSVLEFLIKDGCSLARFSTVSREWQYIIERHNFARIKLTTSRLGEFGSMTCRNQALVRYIWLCLELREYDCSECAPEDSDDRGMNATDNLLITTAFLGLFTTLKTWKSSGSLLLDISIHSPSDAEHWFKYLTFEPDIASTECGQHHISEQSISAKLNDHRHGWVAGRRSSAPNDFALFKIFERILVEEPFDDEEEEKKWWEKLPVVQAVTGVLLRQQTRRRWKPTTLANMFKRFPRLEEVYYEPWMEWYDYKQIRTDEGIPEVFESLASEQLKKLVLFENFDPQYLVELEDCDSIRLPTFGVSRAVAKASLKLERLSASFMVDARYFFQACHPSWTWPSLTWIALTSQLLAPNEDPVEVDDMLIAAAEATKGMPSLQTMEIWNGEKGWAMLFRYQRAEDGQPATITTKGTWEFALRPAVIRTWEAVAQNPRWNGCVMVREILDADDIQTHGDAIHCLKLSHPVIRPISLEQIRLEHRVRMGVLDELNHLAA